MRVWYHTFSCIDKLCFESCERETLEDVDKNSNSFLFEEIGKPSEYIHKEKCQVDLNHLEKTIQN